jgi:hypothetical protein
MFDPVIFAKLFDAAKTALTPTSSESGIPVLLLDDAHAVDASSLTIIDRLMGHGALFCIATVVAGEEVPGIVTRWWRDERAARIDLAERDEVVSTPCSTSRSKAHWNPRGVELWRASTGNMLALRELVLGARHSTSSSSGMVCGRSTENCARHRGCANWWRLVWPGSDRGSRCWSASLCQPLGLGRMEAAAGSRSWRTLIAMV